MIAGTPLSLSGFIMALILMTLWHELGHLFIARLLRIPTRLVAVGIGPVLWRSSLTTEMRFELRAFPVGMSIGVTGRRNTLGIDTRPASHDMAMALGGPLASIVLTLALFILALFAYAWPDVRMWLVTTATLSTILALLNLLPIPGLDGGHLLISGVSLFGWKFSPGMEKKIHQYGLRLCAVACLLFTLGQLLHK
jgi:membrane-associated protease RseP (regulator of RpoE activity)